MQRTIRHLAFDRLHHTSKAAIERKKQIVTSSLGVLFGAQGSQPTNNRPVFGLKPLKQGHGRFEAQTLRVGTVDSRNQRLSQIVQNLRAQPTTYKLRQRLLRLILSSLLDRKHQVHPSTKLQIGTQERPNRGRRHQAKALRNGIELTTPHNESPGVLRYRSHDFRLQPELATQVVKFRLTSQTRLGPTLDRQLVVGVVGLDNPTQPIGRLEQLKWNLVAEGLPGRREAGDTATDDG